MLGSDTRGQRFFSKTKLWGPDSQLVYNEKDKTKAAAAAAAVRRTFWKRLERVGTR